MNKLYILIFTACLSLGMAGAYADDTMKKDAMGKTEMKQDEMKKDDMGKEKMAMPAKKHKKHKKHKMKKSDLK